MTRSSEVSGLLSINVVDKVAKYRSSDNISLTYVQSALLQLANATS